MDEEESLRERLRYAMGQACTKFAITLRWFQSVKEWRQR